MSDRITTTLKHLIPRSLRPFVKGFLARMGFQSYKYSEELNYWRQRFVDGEWILRDYYEERLLALAREDSQDFLESKIVADFGCGPRGSLTWASKARCRIGIDVLSTAYSEFDIDSQNMTYVVSTEKWIPLPTNYVDVMFTMNALDHSSYLKPICREIVRIVKPGGELIASFNLHEQGTFSEPQTLSEELLQRVLLDSFETKHSEYVDSDDGKQKLVFRGTKKG